MCTIISKRTVAFVESSDSIAVLRAYRALSLPIPSLHNYVSTYNGSATVLAHVATVRFLLPFVGYNEQLVVTLQYKV